MMHSIFNFVATIVTFALNAYLLKLIGEEILEFKTEGVLDYKKTVKFLVVVGVSLIEALFASLLSRALPAVLGVTLALGLPFFGYYFYFYILQDKKFQNVKVENKQEKEKEEKENKESLTPKAYKSSSKISSLLDTKDNEEIYSEIAKELNSGVA